MSKKTLYGIFDCEQVLLASAKEIRANKIEIKEVYSPFPIHGLDKVLGLKETRMAITAFIYGCIGLSLGALMIYNIMIVDWPQNIGGKPNSTFYHNMPAFVPILFECTVLFAAHLMSITYLIRCGLFPGGKSDSPDPRTTDDKFLMEIVAEGDVDAVKEIRANKIEIKEVYSPFPVHGLDKALGLKETRMAITAFIYGCIGLSLAALMIYNIMIVDWAQNIGGKPNFTFYHNMPAFIPIMFECTVLFAAHLMSITYLIRCGLFPAGESDSPDPRTTDDKFLMEIVVEGDVTTVKEILRKTGATEINEKDA